jgi:hypothetical protein
MRQAWPRMSHSGRARRAGATLGGHVPIDRVRRPWKMPRRPGRVASNEGRRGLQAFTPGTDLVSGQFANRGPGEGIVDEPTEAPSVSWAPFVYCSQASRTVIVLRDPPPSTWANHILAAFSVAPCCSRGGNAGKSPSDLNVFRAPPAVWERRIQLPCLPMTRNHESNRLPASPSSFSPRLQVFAVPHRAQVCVNSTSARETGRMVFSACPSFRYCRVRRPGRANPPRLSPAPPAALPVAAVPPA